MVLSYFELTPSAIRRDGDDVTVNYVKVAGVWELHDIESKSLASIDSANNSLEVAAAFMASNATLSIFS